MFIHYEGFCQVCGNKINERVRGYYCSNACFEKKSQAYSTYQIFDVSEQAIIENSVTFDGAKTFVAGHWDILEDEEQYNKIMAADSLDQLNNYAEGLDFIIEKQGVDFE